MILCAHSDESNSSYCEHRRRDLFRQCSIWDYGIECSSGSKEAGGTSVLDVNFYLYIRVEHAVDIFGYYVYTPCSAQWQWEMDQYDFRQEREATVSGYSDPYRTVFSSQLSEAIVGHSAANTIINHGDGPVFLHWQPTVGSSVDYKTKWTVIWCVVFAMCWLPILGCVVYSVMDFLFS